MPRTRRILPVLICSLLLVPRIIHAADYLLEKGRAGALAVGMPEADIYKAYPKTLTSPIDVPQEDETVPCVQIFQTEAREQVGLLACLSGKGGIIQLIQVRDPRFKTAAGVGVNSTLKELRQSHQITSIDGGETGGNWAAVESLQMSFELQLDESLRAMLGQRVSNGQPYTGETDPHIPDETKIISVWVR